MDAITFPPAPTNEPNLTYAPGSPEREALIAEIDKLERREKELKAHIGGRRKAGGGPEFAVVEPHDHQHVLGRFKGATQADARAAIKAAGEAAPDWRSMDMDDRCAVLLRAAELLAGPWRQRINAATMLGQSKTAFQAEIDSACELIDFWRFNVHYAKQILTDQPIANSPGVWNRTRPPSARGLRLRDHAVQLHRDRRQPAHRAGPHGQHRGLEAVPDPAAGRVADHGAPRGGRAAAGRHQHGAG